MTARSTTQKTLILGRNPAALLGVIEAALALVGGFWTDLDAEHVGLIMAVIAAAFSLYTAFSTKETTLAIIIGFVKALLALGIGYGLHITQDQTGLLIALVTAVFGLVNHQMTDGPATDAGVAHDNTTHITAGKHEAKSEVAKKQTPPTEK